MNATMKADKPRLRVTSGGRIPAEMAAAFRGADQTSRELVNWDARSMSGDAALLPERGKLTARADDIARNNGYASHVIQVRVDSIVGHQFKLSYKPNWRVLGIDPNSEAAKNFVHDVEARWTDFAEDPNCRIDAEGKRTFSQIIRHGAAGETTKGEIIETVEWLRRPGLRTAIKLIEPDRVCNPNGAPDTMRLRAGILQNRHGAAVTYYIRSRHESDIRFAGFSQTPNELFSWRPVRKMTPWGRLQVIHVFDAPQDGLTRGVSKLAPVLERFKMIDKWQGVELQNAIINAMYALVIESEFDTVTALEAIGASDQSNALKDWMKVSAAYHKGANVTFDGAKIPHLFPNEKLNLVNAKAPSNQQFEDRLLRYVAAGSNFSYEQLSSNWSQTNYSSARAALGEAWRYFLGERELHKRHASLIFSAVLEEMFSKELVRPPAGAPSFWAEKSAWCRCDWIGSGRSMIDGLKETKEIVLKLEAGLITYEKACAQLGEDYKDILDQQIREVRERKEAGLPPPSWMSTQQLAPDSDNENPEVHDNSDA